MGSELALLPATHPEETQEWELTQISPVSSLQPPPHRHPGPGPARTGDVERNGPLRVHASPGEGHPTGEVGAVVLQAGGEQDL